LEVSIPLAAPEQLVPLLDRLWQVGIPHFTFLLPENPDLAYLVQAVERAEDLGMIAGARGRATDLVQSKLLRDVAQAGIDHMTVLVASATAEIHDALLGREDYGFVLPLLADIQANEVYPMVEIPLVESTLPGLAETLTTLQERGVHTFSFFAIVAPDGMDDVVRAGALPAQAMPQTAGWIEEMADALDVRFLWQPPVQRDPAQTLAAQVVHGPRCMGDVAARVEPDGRVIPPRGPYQSAGNVLTDEWQTIWQHDAFTRYRERVAAPTRCADCPGLALCAADCPREAAGWAYQ
ncbi:MAG TPA: SPASM domain-containing protein, partial [Chloroflexota bacterium]|nr:SPASM domain-containing protein [Chloroflexota bacterium]